MCKHMYTTISTVQATRHKPAKNSKRCVHGILLLIFFFDTQGIYIITMCIVNICTNRVKKPFRGC